MTDPHVRDPDTGYSRLETERLASPAVKAIEEVERLMLEGARENTPLALTYLDIGKAVETYQERRRVALGRAA